MEIEAIDPSLLTLSNIESIHKPPTPLIVANDLLKSTAIKEVQLSTTKVTPPYNKGRAFSACA